jgi:hypothetical protein
MLSEFYNNRFAPAKLSSEDAKVDEFVTRWRIDRGFYDSLTHSIQRSLARKYGNEGYMLRRLERELPSAPQVLGEGWKLDDPRLLVRLPEYTSETDQQPVPLGPNESLPLPGAESRQ